MYVRSGTVAAVEADEAAELEGARVRVLSIVLVVNNVEADEAAAADAREAADADAAELESACAGVWMVLGCCRCEGVDAGRSAWCVQSAA